MITARKLFAHNRYWLLLQAARRWPMLGKVRLVCAPWLREYRIPLVSPSGELDAEDVSMDYLGDGVWMGYGPTTSTLIYLVERFPREKLN